MSRRALELLLRFLLVYGVLVWLCYVLPIYAAVERVAVGAVNATLPLAGDDGEQRSLVLEQLGEGYSYVYDVQLPGGRQRLVRGYHKHGFVLVLFVGLALGTPALPWRRRLISFGSGALLTFGLCVGMLMSDLQLWEAEAFVAPRFPPSSGPYPGIVMSMRGLHQTAAAGMLPIIIWAFLVAGPMLDELRRERAPRADGASA